MRNDKNMALSEDQLQLIADGKRYQKNKREAAYRLSSRESKKAAKAIKDNQSRTAKRRALILAQSGDTKALCTRCNTIKTVNNFNKLTDGKRTKMCSACLFKYEARRNSSGGFGDYKYWKDKAYSANTGMLRRSDKFKVRKIADLPYILDAETLRSKAEALSFKCFYCNIDLTSASLSVDHRQAVANGGQHSPENLVVCCRTCNTLKSNFSEDEFYTYMRKYILNFCKALELKDKEPLG